MNNYRLAKSWGEKAVLEAEDLGMMACNHCRSKLQRTTVALLVSLFVFISSSTLSLATSQSNFKLRILPRDCIFTVINAGTQDLLFLTPEICEPPPPPEVPTGGIGEEYRETIDQLPISGNLSPGQPEIWFGSKPSYSGESNALRNDFSSLVQVAISGGVILSLLIIILCSAYLTARYVDSKFSGRLAKMAGIRHHTHHLMGLGS